MLSLPGLGLEGEGHPPEEVRVHEGRVEGRDLDEDAVEPGVIGLGEHVPAEIADRPDPEHVGGEVREPEGQRLGVAPRGEVEELLDAPARPGGLERALHAGLGGQGSDDQQRHDGRRAPAGLRFRLPHS